MNHTKEHSSNNDIYIAALGYLGFLFFIPLIAKWKSAYCRFHAFQSMFMFILTVLVLVILAVLPWLGSLLTLTIFVLYIIAIILTLIGKPWKLPIIGSLINRLMGNATTPTVIHNQNLDVHSKISKESGIGGWLSFFLFSLFLSTILNFVAGIEDVSSIIKTPELTKTWIYGLASLDILYFGGLIGFSLYTIRSFTKLKPNAVSLGKMYLILIFATNLISVLFSAFTGQPIADETSYYLDSGKMISRSLVFSIIWFLYLVYSKRVNNTFPKETRKIKKFDVVFFFITLAIPIVIYSFAFLPSILGLSNDIRNGVQLNYKVDLSKVQDKDQPLIVEEVRNIINKRVKSLGNSKSNVYISKVGNEQHIIVELDEVKDLEQTKMVVGKTIKLEFMEQKKYPGMPDVWESTGLSGAYFQRADVVFDKSLNPIVSIHFNSEGAKLLEEITARNINKPIAIFVSDTLISAPNVNEKISGGIAVITGNFTTEEAQSLARDLNTGALPAPITLVNATSL